MERRKQVATGDSSAAAASSQPRLALARFGVGQRPGLEHVLQHGVVGQEQHPRSLQPLQAQQQRGKQNVGSRVEHRAVAAAIPVAPLLLQRSVKLHDKKTNKASRGQH